MSTTKDKLKSNYFHISHKFSQTALQVFDGNNWMVWTCRFHYMAMADNRQRNMPLPDDRVAPRGQALAYPEAVLLVNPIEPELKGEVHFTLHASH